LADAKWACDRLSGLLIIFPESVMPSSVYCVCQPLNICNLMQCKAVLFKLTETDIEMWEKLKNKCQLAENKTETGKSWKTETKT